MGRARKFLLGAQVVLGDRIFLEALPRALRGLTSVCSAPPTLESAVGAGGGEGAARTGEGRKGGKGLGDRGSWRTNKQTMSWKITCFPFPGSLPACLPHWRQ